MKKRITILTSLLLLPALLSAQSLAELAQRERERRQRIRQEGIDTRVIGQRELRAIAREAEPSISAAPELSETPGVLVLTQQDLEAVADREGIVVTRTSQPETPALVPEPPRETLVTVPDVLPETPDAALLGQEAMWRERARQARMRLEEARRLVERLGELNLPETDDMWIRAEAELAEREREWSRFVEDARRAEVPPGWLR